MNFKVIEAASVDLAILKRLGNSPRDTIKDLSTSYQVISTYALKLAPNEDWIHFLHTDCHAWRSQMIRARSAATLFHTGRVVVSTL